MSTWGGSATAQSQSTKGWQQLTATGTSANGSSQVTASALDAAGNTCVVGSFRGSVGFGTTRLVSGGDQDLFVGKLDAGGNWLWVRQVRGSLYEAASDLAVDAAGNLIITGSVQSSNLQVGSGTVLNHYSLNVLVAKLDANGNWLWSRLAGSPNVVNFNYSVAGTSVTVDAAGNVGLTGSYWQGAVLGNTTLSGGNHYNAYVAKLAADGTWLWAKDVAGPGLEKGTGLACDALGNFYLTGSFNGVSVRLGQQQLTNANTSPLSPVSTDIFVAKLDAAGNWQWAQRVGGLGNDDSGGIATDAAGNSWLAGSFTGSTLTFGATTLSNVSNTSDAFVARLSPTGSPLLAQQITGSGNETAQDIVLTSDGDVVVAGTLGLATLVGTGNAQFGSVSLSYAGPANAFAARLSGAGAWLWARAATGYACRGLSIGAGANGRVVLGGNFEGPTATFGTIQLPGPVFHMPEGYELFAAQLDAAGNWQWAQRSADNGSVLLNAMVVDAAGNQYVAGSFDGTLTVGSTRLSAAGFGDAFIGKRDASGQWLWVRQAGGSNYDYAEGLTLDPAGNVLVTGRFSSYDARFGSQTISTQGGEDVFVSKLTANGDWRWTAIAGGFSNDVGQRMVTDAAGNVYVAGTFAQGIRFGPISIAMPSGFADMFVSKLDVNGNWQWATRASSSGGEAVTGLVTDGSGLYVCGTYGSALTVGSTTLQAQGTDIFLARLTTNGGWSWARRAGGSANDQATCLAYADGQLFVGGSFQGTASFGQLALSSAGSSDAFVALFNLNHDNWGWATQARGSGADAVTALAVDDRGGLHVAGTTGNYISFGDLQLAATSGSQQDVFLARCVDGHWLAAERVSSKATDATAVAALRNDQVLLAGNFFGGLIQFGPLGLLGGDKYGVGFLARYAYSVKAANELAPPNIITPNGDGLNDRFAIEGLPPGAWALQIFNRWGRRIYQTSTYAQDWGPDAAAGTYYYVLTQTGSDVRYQGWLEVVR